MWLCTTEWIVPEFSNKSSGLIFKVRNVHVGKTNNLSWHIQQPWSVSASAPLARSVTLIWRYCTAHAVTAISERPFSTSVALRVDLRPCTFSLRQHVKEVTITVATWSLRAPCIIHCTAYVMTDFPQSNPQQQTYPLFAAQNCKLLFSLKFQPIQFCW